MASRASSKPMPPPRPRQAGFTHIIAETMAVEQEGFPPILGRLVRDVLHSPAVPGYVVFVSAPSPAGSAYQAEVRIVPPSGDAQAYVFRGLPMPTIEQAVQMAAWEALVRLRHSEEAVGKSRAFRFLPGRRSEGAELVPHLPSGEGHPAGPNIVAYTDAVTHLNNLLMREIGKMRHELAQARTERALYQVPSTLGQPPTQAAGYGPIDPSPSQPEPGVDQPLFPQQVPRTPRPGTYAAFFDVLARAQQLRQETQAAPLIGQPIYPNQVDDVDTELRL